MARIACQTKRKANDFFEGRTRTMRAGKKGYRVETHLLVITSHIQNRPDNGQQIFYDYNNDWLMDEIDV